MLALAWPAVSAADHVSITATVSARLAERSEPASWIVAVTWTATCPGAAPGHENYTGTLNLVDLDMGERDRARVDRRDKVHGCERLSFR